MSSSAKLAVQDADDLQIVSARLQDAVARVKDLVWLPKTHRFAALFNRFKWEDAVGGAEGLRVRAGFHLEHVLSAKSHNIQFTNREAVLSLLAIRFTPHGEDGPSGIIEFVFSGGGAIRLEVECIEASLVDFSGEWPALGRPSHPIEA
ncbi:MAG: DUF2948 family protein [Alphaproteobacteria bacterium]|nr:DUF2948 family protein [Alphaproteobacteria bacterium]MBV9062302.1 DUF2948 family protein [Alphaproteobacteria bacterium]